MPEQKDWVYYWRGLRFMPRKSYKCFICENWLEPGVIALKNQDKIYCHSCAEMLYERIMEDLSIFNDRVKKIASRLGHKLNNFNPGFNCDWDHAIMVSECMYCHNRVCYEVVDIVHNIAIARERPVILYRPIGFPLKHPCPSIIR